MGKMTLCTIGMDNKKNLSIHYFVALKPGGSDF